MAQGFLGGFAKGASEDLDRREQTALELKMRSSLMEQQAQKEQALLEFRHNLSKIPQDEFTRIFGTAAKNQADLVKSLIPGANPEALSPEGISSPEGQAAFAKLLETNPMLRMMGGSGAIADIGGQATNIVRDKFGNVIRTQPLGQSAKTFSTQADAETKFGDFRGNLEEIRDTIKHRMLASPGLVSRAKQYAGMTWDQIVQSGDPAVLAYLSQNKLQGMELDKQLTGTSRFASEFVGAGQEALPQKSDSAAVAMAKLDRLEKQGWSKMDSAYAALRVPLQNRLYKDPDLYGNVMDAASQNVDKIGQQKNQAMQMLMQKLDALTGGK